jgi:hypothetical protein
VAQFYNQLRHTRWVYFEVRSKYLKTIHVTFRLEDEEEYGAQAPLQVLIFTLLLPDGQMEED